MSEIDGRAEVSSSARIGRNVKIGPFAVVAGEVELGENCIVDHHAVVQGPARLGQSNHIFSFSVVGGDPPFVKNQTANPDDIVAKLLLGLRHSDL